MKPCVGALAIGASILAAACGSSDDGVEPAGTGGSTQDAGGQGGEAGWAGGSAGAAGMAGVAGAAGTAGGAGAAGAGGAPPTCPGSVDLVNAPPITDIDGLHAVPIDMDTLQAKVVIDATTQQATAEATMTFLMGPEDGYPIFDLRQTITKATLNGQDVSPSKMAKHDFKGGTGAEVRVIESELKACSENTLVVQYALGQPDSPKSIPIAFSDTDKTVTWDFWLGDLFPGRYLEQWFPANLIYDRFIFTLDLELTGTDVPHSPVNNGVSTELGTGHWKIEYPDHFSALSPLLFLAPDSFLTGLSTSVTLANNSPLVIEVYKEEGMTEDLATVTSDLVTWFNEFNASAGDYAHGDRFLALLWTNATRSMEYDGATTSNAVSLQHETFHSWWGRGLRPARAIDGWIDEAWDKYCVNGVDSYKVEPLDFTKSQVTLCSSNPWSRVTPGNSYTAGATFFAGIAAIMGVDELKASMRDFYEKHLLDVMTTQQLEAHLCCWAKSEPAKGSEIKAAFYRFVYGKLSAPPEFDAATCP